MLSRGAVARECQTGDLCALEVEGLRLERAYMAILPRGVYPAPAERALLALAGIGKDWTPVSSGATAGPTTGATL